MTWLKPINYKSIFGNIPESMPAAQNTSEILVNFYKACIEEIEAILRKPENQKYLQDAFTYKENIRALVEEAVKNVLDKNKSLFSSLSQDSISKIKTSLCRNIEYMTQGIKNFQLENICDKLKVLAAAAEVKIANIFDMASRTTQTLLESLRPTTTKSEATQALTNKRNFLARLFNLKKPPNPPEPPSAGTIIPVLATVTNVAGFVVALSAPGDARTMADAIYDEYKLDGLISYRAFNKAYEFSKGPNVPNGLKRLYNLDVTHPKQLSKDTINKYNSLAVAYEIYIHKEQYKHKYRLTEKDWQEISANYLLLTSYSENLPYSATQYMIAYLWYKELNEPKLKDKLSFTDMLLTLDILLCNSKDKVTFSNSENGNLVLKQVLEQIIYPFAQARLFPDRRKFYKIQRRPLD